MQRMWNFAVSHHYLLVHTNAAVPVDVSTHIHRIEQFLPGYTCSASHFVCQSTGKKAIFTAV